MTPLTRRTLIASMGLGFWAFSTRAGQAASPDQRQYTYYLFDAEKFSFQQLLSRSTPLGARFVWSPDARRLIYDAESDGNSDLWEWELQSGRRTKLTEDPLFEGWPSCSPDGRWIAFDRGELGQRNVWRMRPDGSEPQQLTHDPTSANDARWSPDSRQILFASGRDAHDTGFTQFYVVNADGSNTRRLTTNAAGSAEPQWSPDSRQIAYGSHQGARRSLTVLDLVTGAERQVTLGPELEMVAQWSRDGQTLLVTRYVLHERAAADVYLLDVNHPNERKLTTKGGNWHAVCWSHDERRVFLSASNGLCVMNADGTELQALTRCSEYGYWQIIPAPGARQMLLIYSEHVKTAKS